MQALYAHQSEEGAFSRGLDLESTANLVFGIAKPNTTACACVRQPVCVCVRARVFVGVLVWLRDQARPCPRARTATQKTHSSPEERGASYVPPLPEAGCRRMAWQQRRRRLLLHREVPAAAPLRSLRLRRDDGPLPSAWRWPGRPCVLAAAAPVARSDRPLHSADSLVTDWRPPAGGWTPGPRQAPRRARSAEPRAPRSAGLPQDASEDAGSAVPPLPFLARGGRGGKGRHGEEGEDSHGHCTGTPAAAARGQCRSRGAHR